MIKNMVEQCNTHTNRIMELFIESHAVTRKVLSVLDVWNTCSFCSQLDFVTEKSRIAEKDRDPRLLTPTLDEMASICKCAEFYIRYVTRKIMVPFIPVVLLPIFNMCRHCQPQQVQITLQNIQQKSTMQLLRTTAK